MQVNDMRKDRERSGSKRGAIMERMRGSDRGEWGARMGRMKKAEEVVLSENCCEKES